MNSDTKVDIIVNVTEEEIRQAKLAFKTKKIDPWDPVDAFDLEKTSNNVARILARYIKLKTQPDLPKKHRKRVFIFATVILVPTLIPILVYNNYFVTVLMLIFAAAVYLVIYGEYRKLAIDLIKISLAEEKNWYYDPYEDAEKWKLLVKDFKEIFAGGNIDQRIEDQFWGSVVKDNREYDFYSGLFHYTYKKRSSSTKKSTSDQWTYHKNFICFRIPKQLHSRFLLKARNLSQKEKKAENPIISFNDAFELSFEGSVEYSGREIVSTLSKEVQERLLKMRKAKGPFVILFAGNCVIIMFWGVLFKRIKTDLFHKGLFIHPEDKEYIDTQISSLLDISLEIVEYLD